MEGLSDTIGQLGRYIRQDRQLLLPLCIKSSRKLELGFHVNNK